MSKELQLPGPTARSWHPLTLVCLIVAVLGFCFTAPGIGTAFSQEEGTPAEDAEAEEEPTEDGGDAAADTAEDGDDEFIDKKSFLEVLIDASGYFGLVLLLLSFIMVALIMMNVLQVRRDNLLPAAFIEAFEQKLTSKDYQGAYEIARSDDSFVARVLAAGLGKLNRGYSEAIEGMQEVGEDENMALEHRLSYLALIGSIAPMIGLMGTVYGMILSFEEIATSPVSPKPKDLAFGIQTALFTTLEGLMVAVPALVCYSILRNRVARFVMEVGMVSEGLMSRIPKQRPAGGAAPGTAPAQSKQ